MEIDGDRWHHSYGPAESVTMSASELKGERSHELDWAGIGEARQRRITAV
jgi:hypothetical protein